MMLEFCQPSIGILDSNPMGKVEDCIADPFNPENPLFPWLPDANVM